MYKQLVVSVRKYQDGVISDRKMTKVYQRLVCAKCEVKECVMHPATLAPDGYEDELSEKMLNKIDKKKFPIYCCHIPSMIDSYLDGDYISDALLDKLIDEDAKTGLVDKSEKFLRTIAKDVIHLSKYKDEDTVITLRHLSRAVTFLLRHSNLNQ